MKLRVTLDIDVPDEMIGHVGTQYETGALYEAVADGVIRYAQGKHAYEAFDWHYRSFPENRPVGTDPVEWEIITSKCYRDHTTWGEILEASKWTVEKI